LYSTGLPALLGLFLAACGIVVFYLFKGNWEREVVAKSKI
jgi:hypothetical protein